MKKFFLLSCFLMFFFGGKGFGATFTVTNNTDNATPLAGSLRKAIQDAVSGDVIVFSISNVTITLTSPLVISKNITIDGGNNNITISGGDNYRIFNINSANNVTIRNLTLTNGLATGGEGGGAIKILGITSGTTTLENLYIKSSVAGDEGGGGVLFSTNANVVVNNVTITACSSNAALGGGGVVINNTGVGSIVLNNCTIYNNATPGFIGGGGIHIANGNTTINNCTIVKNNATDGSSQGGGIYKWGGGVGTVNINNSIILDNTATSGNDLYGGFASTHGNNIYSDLSGTITGTGNQVILPAQIPQVLEQPYALQPDQAGSLVPYLRLRPKTDNSHPTAINKAFNATLTDTRGVKRKGEWAGGVSDVGAWESMVVGNNASRGRGSIRDAVAFANGNFGDDKVFFDVKTPTPHTITLDNTENTPIEVQTGTTIDGYTQSGANPAVGTTPATLQIEITRNASFTNTITFNITGNSATIKGLCINGFNNSNQSAISVSSNSNTGNINIQGNHIGTDLAGTLAKPNFYGIVIGNTAQNINIGDPVGISQAFNRNVISGNSNAGIYSNTSTGLGNVIRGNYIGTTAGGLSALPNLRGIDVVGSVGTTTLNITNNTISGNTNEGISFGTNGIGATIIKGNKIGIGRDGTTPTANNIGISFSTNTQNIIAGGTTAGEPNIIAYNNTAINSRGLNNQFIRNQFFCNTTAIFGAGNGNNANPVITTANTATIAGTCDGCTSIDVYEMDNTACGSNNTPQGKLFVQSVPASANVWSVTGTFTSGKKIVALAQSVTGTSRFSDIKIINTIPVKVDAIINTAQEDIVFDFSLTSIEACFSDADGSDQLEAFRITELSALSGAILTLNSVPVSLNQIITRVQMTAGAFRIAFPSNANFNTGIVPSFKIKVSDGKDYSTQDAVITLNPQPVNDAPSFTPAVTTITINEDAPAYIYTNFFTNVSKGGGTDEISQTFTIVNNPATNAAFSVMPNITNISATNADLTFTLAPNYFGTINIGIRIRDSGGVANGGIDQSTEQTITIIVNPVNDAPILSAPANTTLSYTEASGAVVLSNAGLGIIDVDNTTLTSATVTISNGYQSPQDELVLSPLPVGITSATFSGGTLAILGNGTLAQFINALQNVTYQNISQNPNTNSRTISFQVNDGGGTNNLSNAVTMTVNVQAVNNAPTLTISGNTATTFTEGAGEISVINAGATIDVNDMDNLTITSFRARITTNYESNFDVLSLPTSANYTTSFSVPNGELQVTFTPAMPYAYVATILKEVKFNNTSNNPSTLTRTVSFQINDGQASNNLSNPPITQNVNVVSVNSSPILSMSGAGVNAIFIENQGSVFIPPTGASFGISDIENNKIVSFTATISGGYFLGDELSAPTTPPYISSVNFDVVTQQLKVIFDVNATYTYADVTTTLSAIKFNHNTANPTNFGNNPTRTIDLQINDGQANNNLSTPALPIILNVSGVNQNPSITQSPANPPFTLSLSTNEDTSLPISFDATDVDNTPSQLTWTILTNPINGVISPNTITGLNYTFNYTPNADYFGNDSFVVRVSDGVSPTSFSELTINVSVNAVNDAPIFTTSALATQPNINVNSLPVTINLSGINAGGGLTEANQTLAFTIISSNPALLAIQNTAYTSPNTTGTFQYKVLQSVTAPTNVTITINLEDNGSNTTPNVNNSTQTFVVPIVPETNFPFDFTATTISNTRIDLSWENVAGNTGYEVQRSLNTAFTGVVATNVNANVTTYTDEGLTNNTQYYYRVRALNPAGNSDWSATKGAKTADIALSPSNLQAITTTHDKISLTWNDNSTNETAFLLERSSFFTNNFFEEIAQLNANVTSHIDSTVRANVVYKYRVRAINDNGSSDYSNEAVVSTLTNPSIAPPVRPTNARVITVSPRQIELTWEYNLLPNIIFQVERRKTLPAPSTVFESLGLVGNDINASLKFYNDTTSLVEGEKYCYRIRAIGAGGTSPYSDTTCGVAYCNLGSLIVRSDNPTSSSANISIQVCTGKSASLLINKNVYKGVYQWKRNGTNIAGANFRNFFATETGLYTCEVSLGGTCSGNTINGAVVDVSNSPQNVNILYRFANNIGTLRASVVDAGMGNYQWYKDYQPLRDSTNYFIRTNTPGTYFVVVKDNGCASTSDLYVIGLTALENSNDISKLLTISPNPAETNININIDANIYGNCEFYLVDMQGKRIFLQKEEKTQAQLQTKYPIENFAKGLYFLEVRCGKYTGRKKVMLR